MSLKYLWPALVPVLIGSSFSQELTSQQIKEKLGRIEKSISEMTKLKQEVDALKDSLQSDELKRIDAEIESYNKKLEAIKKTDKHFNSQDQSEIEKAITSLRSKKFTILSTNISNQKPDEQSVAERFSFEGLIEVDAIQSKNFSRATQSKVELATLELASEISLSDYLKTNILIEKDDPPASSFGVTEAFITYGNTADKVANFRIGKMVIPFGEFETSMISDPLGLNFGESHEEVLMGELDWRGLITSAYIFRGSTKEQGQSDRIRHYGAQFGYLIELENLALQTAFSYLSSLAETDGVQGVLSSTTLAKNISGSALSVIARYLNYSLVTEYITANEKFNVNDLSWNGNGAKPSTFQSEFSYTLDLKHETTISAGYQRSSEALALGLAKTKYLLSVVSLINSNASVAFEQSVDEDYNTNECSSTTTCGTGLKGYTSTLRFALSF